jgi:hypothetical protein
VHRGALRITAQALNQPLLIKEAIEKEDERQTGEEASPLPYMGVKLIFYLAPSSSCPFLQLVCLAKI